MEDARLTRLTEICLKLPKVECELMQAHASFKIGKKPFVYFLNDHHDDGIVGIWCKVMPGENAALIAANPNRFYMPAYVGPRGWVGLRLDVGKPDWSEVAELVKGSYKLLAGKRLAAMV